MCLIFVAWQVLPEYPLVLAANRDEFYARPTAPLAAWPQAAGVFAGRDLETVSGPAGTWLGIRADARFAAITNVRGARNAPPGFYSRGGLASTFLLAESGPVAEQTMPDTPLAYARRIHAEQEQQDRYQGYNLLLGDEESLVYHSNRSGAGPQRLAPGFYGLSNATLNTPWPKVKRGLLAFQNAVERLGQAHPFLPDQPSPDAATTWAALTAPLFSLLSDQSPVADADLPHTGLDLATERLLSTAFIRSADYGTRASTVLVRRRGAGHFISERRFAAQGFIGSTAILV